ncbi:hypothetical protein H5A18_11660 [Pectobacterium brasiliense]|uniref:hypothetical protein n=1 Tax=Pectobacterium brasiliense TaxID=180957 RepID=UPI000CE68983|nr:hypothetical protein [Pectobacterium brasiliense]MBN3182558.1 hypothetical protein [Pectobacterium brasiliense]PPE64791.1 hypothetical protein F152LOC_00256 [Pectobacterium brasiliense]
MEENNYKTMSCEGLVNRALNLIKASDSYKINGRWLVNQTNLNGPSDDEIQPVVKAHLITALSIFNLDCNENELDDDIVKLVNAKTKGEVRQILSEVIPKLSDE